MTAKVVNDCRLEERLLEAKGMVAVAFLLYESIPCKHFKPEFLAVAAKMAEKMEFLVISVDENPSLTEFLQVTAAPTTVVFKDGDEIKRYEGPYERLALEERLMKVLVDGGKEQK